MDPQIQILRTQLVEKKQASDTLYCTIKEAIATGLLSMGTRLREEELAEVFDVSRTPVREAMKKLEMEQLIQSNSVSGSTVRTLSVDECLDTLEVLELLRAAACNLLIGRIPRSLLMVLEQNTRKGEHLKDSFQRYENNAEFHDLLVKATGNSVLEKLNQQLSAPWFVPLWTTIRTRCRRSWLTVRKRWMSTCGGLSGLSWTLTDFKKEETVCGRSAPAR